MKSLEKKVSFSNRRVSIASGDNISIINEKIMLKYGDPLEAVSAIFSDFLRNIAIHGVKYFGAKRRHWSERVFWIVAFIISLFTCSTAIYNIYSKWQHNPVIVSFSEKSTPIWQIPFPAITICPETKARMDSVNFTQIFLAKKNKSAQEFSKKELEYFEAVSQVCDPDLFIRDNITLESCLKPEKIVKTLKDIKPEDIFFESGCKWNNYVEDCHDLFDEVITEEGICYTFNTLKADEIFRSKAIDKDFQFTSAAEPSDFWTLENGYTSASVGDIYPRRVIAPGSRAGLAVVLVSSRRDMDYYCRGPVQGFKLLLHTPGEIPRASKNYFRIPKQQEVLVSVKPNMIKTSRNLVDYKPHGRQCYFDNERYLRFFKTYSQNNCEIECLANFTLNKCGCVKFSMPRDHGTKICPQSKIECYDQAEDELLEKKNNLKFALRENENNRERGTICACLPACTSLSYDAEISMADFEHMGTFMGWNESLNPGLWAYLNEYNFSRLTIFFKEAQFITSRRSELYGWLDFVANCGGLLGLFMGMSILSLIEIFYYATLRLGCHLNYRRKKEIKRRKSLSDGNDDFKESNSDNSDSSAFEQ